jgi:hypothetical protein
MAEPSALQTARAPLPTHHVSPGWHTSGRHSPSEQCSLAKQSPSPKQIAHSPDAESHLDDGALQAESDMQLTGAGTHSAALHT